MKFVWAEKRNNENRFVEEHIPPGKYDATVSKCFWEKREYLVNDYNPEGTCLVLWLDIKLSADKVKRIFERISITDPSRFNNLLTSAGFNPISEDDEFDETQLCGTVVNVDLETYTSKNGNISNIVKKYSTVHRNNQKENLKSTITVAF